MALKIIYGGFNYENHLRRKRRDWYAPQKLDKLLEVHIFMAKKGQTYKKYSPEFKLSVILDMREHHLNYSETARKYDLIQQSKTAPVCMLQQCRGFRCVTIMAEWGPYFAHLQLQSRSLLSRVIQYISRLAARHTHVGLRLRLTQIRHNA